MCDRIEQNSASRGQVFEAAAKNTKLRRSVPSVRDMHLRIDDLQPHSAFGDEPAATIQRSLFFMLRPSDHAVFILYLTPLAGQTLSNIHTHIHLSS